jgi:ketosteroid isomerase-like protein
MLSNAEIRAEVDAWIASWNRHDVDAILAHYSEDVEVQGPSIVERWGRADGRLHGKGELRRHFERGFELTPTSHFELEDVLFGPESFVMIYRKQDGVRVLEVVRTNEAGLSVDVQFFYSEVQG